MRKAAILFGLAALLGAAPASLAQTFTFSFYEGSGVDNISTTDFVRYLNLSRCLCDEARGDDTDAYLWVRVHQEGGSFDGGDVFFFVGTNCTDAAVPITERCHELPSIRHVEFQRGDQYIPVPVNYIVNPVDGVCTEETSGSNTFYVIIGNRNNAASGEVALSFDTRGEDPPTNLSATGGEGAVNLKWSVPVNNSNIEYLNVLCALEGTPAPEVSSEAKADWLSTRELCDMDLFVGDATEVGAAVDCAEATGGLNAGNAPSPCYVCASTPAGSTSLRLSGLKNGLAYSFALVSVDFQGNVSITSEVVSATPIMTTDFAEHYKESGGAEEGGFCYVATAVYGDRDHPEVMRLRGFRDSVLLRSASGRRFVRWYYREGPGLALMQGIFPELGLASRVALGGLGHLAALAQGEPRGPEGGLPLGMLLFATAMIALRSRSGRGQHGEAASAGAAVGAAGAAAGAGAGANVEAQSADVAAADSTGDVEAQP